jgi:hypothetical protein
MHRMHGIARRAGGAHVSEKSNAVAMKLCDELLARAEMAHATAGWQSIRIDWTRDGHWNRIGVLGPLYNLRAQVEVDMEGAIGVRAMDDGLSNERIFRDPEEALDHILLCCR